MKNCSVDMLYQPWKHRTGTRHRKIYTESKLCNLFQPSQCLQKISGKNTSMFLSRSCGIASICGAKVTATFIFISRGCEDCHLLIRTPPINSDQNSGIDPNVDQFRSMPINPYQFRSILGSVHYPALIGIERNWLALISNYRHWEAFRINAMILVGIDRHWALIGWVLFNVRLSSYLV